MMRVLHIYKTYLPDSFGGVEQVIAQLTHASAALGVESRLLTVSTNAVNGNIHGLDIIRAPMHMNYASCPVSFRFQSSFQKQVAWADVLHYHFPWPFAELYHLQKNVIKPAIVTYHADIVKQRWLKKCYQPIFRRFMHKVKHIVVASPNYLESSIDLQAYRDKTTVIPFGFKAPSHLERSIQVDLPLLPQKFIVFVGVLRYYKGLHILLDALVGTDISLVILGDGPEQQRLKQQAERLQLTQQIYFLGKVSDAFKWQVIQRSMALILPSHLRAEAFGMSLLEGQMFKKPLISTELGSGTSFVNLHEQTGFVVPANDPESLRQSMLCLWQDHKLATAMGEAGYQRYCKHFSPEIMTERYLSLYHNCLMDVPSTK
jgi:glycosyltransferase involved in cell wall biosynthesis